MGRINDAMLDYLEDNERFADLFNGCCFQGKRVIDPSALTEGSEIYLEKVPEGRSRGKNGALPPGVRENRRNLAPDAQYLCGLRKEDRLAPCYTICLYHGEKPWDGPRNLKDMMGFEKEDGQWKELFSDYRMHLVCLNEMKDYSCFHSPLREVFELIPLRGDKEALLNFLESHPAYCTLDGETAEVAGALIGLKNFGKEKYEEGGVYNMCTAVRELIRDSKDEGRKEGRKEGREEGREEAEAYFSALTLKLLESGRLAELERSARDGKFREQLYKELGIL